MNNLEMGVAVATTVMFVAGLGVLIAAVRERLRTRNQWGDRG